MLDAGFILRKPRLRLSHDLIVSRGELVAAEMIPDDGTFELIIEQEVRLPQPLMVTTQPIVHQPLPMLVELMKEAQFIGAAEVQALTNQMRSFPMWPCRPGALCRLCDRLGDEIFAVG
ncbi:MAG: hypothetical protein HC888_10090 [Candidatus Competibacteraceae bacterium]|nr:hypothetical protein [Candidatus Competibacteraceae bacterium]